MKTLMNLLMTGAIVGMMSASAMAGGDGNGGAKDDGTIVVKNDVDDHVLLVKIGAPTDTRISTLFAEGAQLVPPNGTASFDVAAGTQKVVAVLVDDVTYVPLNAGQLDVNVGKQETVHVTATADGGDTDLD